MNPRHLVDPDTPNVLLALACRACGKVWNLGHEPLAEACCRPRACADCGAVVAEAYYTACEACRDRHATEAEAARYAKAAKVDAEAHPNDPVYWEGGKGDMVGDHYFHSVTSLLEWCRDHEVEPPEYAWACTRRELSMRADDLIEGALEEWYEDARHDLSPAAEKTLQELLDAWCAEQAMTYWEACHATAVVLPEAWRRKVLDELREDHALLDHDRAACAVCQEIDAPEGVSEAAP